MVKDMKFSTLVKIIKFLKATKIAIPIVLLAVGVATKVSLLGKGDPGGDPIEDDPVPI